jgi:hypothetical protein
LVASNAFMAMKTIFYLSALCLGTLFIYPLQAQVVVTGHVSAEIVDIVSIYSQTVVSQEVISLSDFVFGEVAVTSGDDMAFQVLLSPATVKGKEGNVLFLETSYTSLGKKNEEAVSSLYENSDRVLQLKSNTDMLHEQAPGPYQGSCRLTLSYN